jgi:alpha-tubulin suppressor-like RCC1 family protein
MVLDAEGRLYVAGSNELGQLGLGDTRNREDLTLVPSLSGIRMVANGTYHTLALDEHGWVWGWGINKDNQVTRDRRDPVLHPVKLNLENIQSVGCNILSSAALDDQEKVWVWGKMFIGHLGIDGNSARAPTQVPNLDGVVSLVTGGEGFLALMDNGTVKAWGHNGARCLGFESEKLDVNIPTIIPGLTDIRRVAKGNHRCLGLDDQGRVWSWGERQILEIISNLPEIMDIACGDNCSLALDDQGRVWSWGDKSDHTIGRVTNDPHIPDQIPGLESIVEIICRRDVSAALSNQGILFVWGQSMFGSEIGTIVNGELVPKRIDLLPKHAPYTLGTQPIIKKLMIKSAQSTC